MASILIQTTALSSLHLVPADTVQVGPYAERQRYRDSGSGRILGDYLQPAQLTDQLLIQFHAEKIGITPATVFRLFFYNAKGQRVRTRVVTGSYVDITGNTAQKTGGTTVSMRTFTYTLSFAQQSLPPGIYMVICEVNDGSAPLPNGQYRNVRYLISEWVSVKKSWPRTVLISYKHRINKDNFVWEQTGAVGQFRVEGAVRDLDLDSAGEDYEDGNYDPLLLASHAFETWELTTPPVPLYVRQKLNKIKELSSVAYDGRLVVRQGKPTQSDAGNYLRTYSHTFKTQHDAEEYLSGGGWAGLAMRMSGTPTGLMAMPNILYPYVVADIGVNGTYYPVSMLVQGPDDVESVVDTLNSHILGGSGAYNLGGSFVARNGVIGYISNGIEALQDISLTLLTHHTEVMVGTGGLSGSSTLSVTANGDFIAIQADTGLTNIELSSRNATPASTFTRTHAYTGLTQATARVFTGDSTTSISLSWAANPAFEVKTRAGLWTSFSGNFNTLSSFDASVLSGALPTLASFSIRGAQLASVTGLNQDWGSLLNISVINSALSSLSVDNVLYDVAAYVQNTGTQNGTLNLSGQNPAAPPALGGATVTYLQSQGWTVTTD